MNGTDETAGSERGATPASTPTPASRRRRLLAPWLALAVVLAASLAVVAVRSAPDDSAAARSGRLARELRCPTCQGLSVAESNDPSSEAIRADVKERVEAGESDGEIRASYVALYGETILLRPEGRGLGVVVWGLPVAVLVAGAGGIAFALRRGRSHVRRPGVRRRIFAVGALTAVAAGSGVAIAVAAGDRTPGRSGAEAQAPTRAERRAALADAVERAPDDYDARIAYARFITNDDESLRLEAIRQFDAAAAIDPTQPEPQAYSGWLIALSAGDAPSGSERRLLLDGAHQRIDRAMTLDPEYPDAHVFKGLVLFDLEGDAESAIPHFQRYLQLTPADDPMREVVLGALAAAVEQSPTTATTSAPTTTATTPSMSSSTTVP